MAQPKEVTSVTVTEGTQFERTGGTTQVRTATYYIGNHGPFYYTKPVGEFSTETVNRSMEETVKMLRGIGALPAGG
jgi:hypothetical protein